jgi:hypothetical protein
MTTHLVEMSLEILRALRAFSCIDLDVLGTFRYFKYFLKYHSLQSPTQVETNTVVNTVANSTVPVLARWNLCLLLS